MDRIEFDRFVEHCGLKAEDVETLGSIGSPGCGTGWSPAISFGCDDPDAIVSAYVTPNPETQKASYDDNDWDRVRLAMLAVYG